MKTVILFLLNIIFNATANLMIKQGMMQVKDIKLNSFNDVVSKMLFNPMLITGCVCFGLSLIFYSFVLQKINLNIAYPIVVSGSVLLVTIISKLVLSETVKISQGLGIFVILLGIFIVVR